MTIHSLPKSLIETAKKILTESVEHPMIDVDGEMKHRHNSNGQPIHHTDEGIRNFHRWFGDSKVVDEHGRPMVVYHGTTHGNFDVFNTDNKKGDTKDFNSSIGSHFTENKHIAEKFANGLYGNGGTPHVHKVYLKITTPLTQDGKHIITPKDVKNDTDRFNAENKEYKEKQKKFDLSMEPHMNSDEFHNLLTNKGVDAAFEFLKTKQTEEPPKQPKAPIRRNPISEKDLVEKTGISYDLMVDKPPLKRKKEGALLKASLIQNGHDGVYYMNSNEQEGWGSHTWIAFHPHQIKSAIGNNGDFHPDKPQINESAEDPTIHTTNSLGLPIHRTVEGIHNFNKWFEGSQVKDEHGRPLVVYHGTNAHAYSPDEEIKNFHTNPESGRGAAFFTSNKSLAHEYGEKVYHTYLKLKNPLVIDAQGKHWSSISHNSPIKGKATEQLNSARKQKHDEMESIAKDMQELFGDPYTPREFNPIKGSLEGHQLKHIPGLEHDDLETDQVVKVAKRHGFDGVVFHNVKDSPTNDHGYRHDTADVYAVFHPQHIKSTDNSGQFGTEWNHGIKE